MQHTRNDILGAREPQENDATGTAARKWIRDSRMVDSQRTANNSASASGGMECEDDALPNKPT